MPTAGETRLAIVILNEWIKNQCKMPETDHFVFEYCHAKYGIYFDNLEQDDEIAREYDTKFYLLLMRNDVSEEQDNKISNYYLANCKKYKEKEMLRVTSKSLDAILRRQNSIEKETFDASPPESYLNRMRECLNNL